MKNWIIGAILVLVAAAAYYYFAVYQPPVPVEQTAEQVVVVEPVEEPVKAPDITDLGTAPDLADQPEIPMEAEQAPLPSLVESDPVVLESLDGLLSEPVADRYVINDNVISRVVATIDMLGGRQVPAVVQALEGPEGSFQVMVNDSPETVINNEEGDPIPQFFIDPSNYARYTPYVDMLEAADTAEVVENYRSFYPLFQEAYQQMGYADGDFNARLIAIIDELLATPEVTGPVELIKPEAYFLYTNPELESLSAGQKILLRMGNDNASRVKSKLAEVRASL
jgi:hypothetical protein